MYSINLVGVFVAAIVAFILGFLFHGPLLGKLWMRLANITPTGNEKFSDMYGQMIWNFVMNMITAYGLAVLYSFTSGTMSGAKAVSGMICGFLGWVFIMTSSAMHVIWMGKSYKLWLFEALASLVVMLSMGAIVAVW